MIIDRNIFCRVRICIVSKSSKEAVAEHIWCSLAYKSNMGAVNNSSKLCYGMF